MKHSLRILLLPALLGICALSLQAQTSGNNSPYSRYGWGTLSDEATGFNKAMAGVAYGMRQGNILNHQNPAAYSTIDSLTLLFDAGVTLQNCTFKTGSKTKNAKNSTLDYITAGFRMGRGLGFSLGIRPVSHIGYDFSSTQNLDDVDGYGEKTATSKYSGEGGLHEAFAGIGWSPVKPLSIGANVHYIWGDYSHTSNVSYTDKTIKSHYRKYQGKLNAVTADFGFQFQHQVTKKDVVTLGAVYTLHNRVGQTASFINYQAGTTTTSGDTTHVSNAYQLPTKIGVGLAWNHDNHWIVGFDYTLEKWGKCRFPSLVANDNAATFKVDWNQLQDRHKFALGMEYIPNPRSIKVKDHICYRAGLAYHTPYTKINGKDGPQSYLVTLGVGLPIVNKHSQRSFVNISAQYEHSDSKAVNAIKEDYLRLCLGITFNASWFSKWKVE